MSLGYHLPSLSILLFASLALPISAFSSDVVTCEKYNSPNQTQAEAELRTWVFDATSRTPILRRLNFNHDRRFKKTVEYKIEDGFGGLAYDPATDIPQWINTLLGKLESHYVETSKGKVHYLKAGNGPKVLIFFHGNPTWSFIWRNIIKILDDLDPNEYTFIAPDLPNLGFSHSFPKPSIKDDLSQAVRYAEENASPAMSLFLDHLADTLERDKASEDRRFKMENVSATMDEFIKTISAKLKDETGKSLEENKDVTLVVQDWGGPIGFSTAVRNPTFYNKMVILNTGVGIPGELPDFQAKAHHWAAPLAQKQGFSQTTAKIAAKFGEQVGGLFGTPFTTRLGNVNYDKESISGIISRAYEYPARYTDNLDMAVYFARMVPATITDKTAALESVPLFEKNTEYLRAFKGPIQVVWGMEDGILGPELEATVKGILPDNTVYTKVLAGHFLQEECPKEIAQAIRNVQTQEVAK
ncbi:MAG: alpha/beta fold hydrolase [Pseudomonadota bacterium]